MDASELPAIQDKQSNATGLQVGSATDIGRVRDRNEDALFVDAEIGLFVVADGMGGHRGGALASKIVVEDLPVMIENALDRLKVGSPKTIRWLLKNAIAEQSRQLHLEGTSESGYKDMGTTIVLALLWNRRCYIANIGDSRAYLLRKGRLRLLTRDHSVVSELIHSGQIEPDQADTHPAQGQITRYLGMEDKARAFVRSFALKNNDRLLLCSDGLTDMLPDETISEILSAQRDPQLACTSLIAAANAAGGHDNITAIVIDWLRR